MCVFCVSQIMWHDFAALYLFFLLFSEEYTYKNQKLIMRESIL